MSNGFVLLLKFSLSKSDKYESSAEAIENASKAKALTILADELCIIPITTFTVESC